MRKASLTKGAHAKMGRRPRIYTVVNVGLLGHNIQICGLKQSGTEMRRSEMGSGSASANGHLLLLPPTSCPPQSLFNCSIPCRSQGRCLLLYRMPGIAAGHPKLWHPKESKSITGGACAFFGSRKNFSLLRCLLPLPCFEKCRKSSLLG